jgi:hypothetical protein
MSLMISMGWMKFDLLNSVVSKSGNPGPGPVPNSYFLYYNFEHPIEEQIEFSPPSTLKIIFNRPSLYATRKTLLWPHFIRMSESSIN